MPHFHTWSCGSTQEVAKLTARLEQFRTAYEALAGAKAVASLPINVIALPDHDSLAHFTALYHGKPMNVSGFFHRSSDENLIVLSLADSGSGALETILHEYAHFLLRRNQQFWPMWLNEGMADIYATFVVTGDHEVQLGRPQEIYLKFLADGPLMPLSALFAVKHDSAEYNEGERQGMFYAESWLLTHYLMIGNPVHRARFGKLTALLKQGQSPEQAFTNAFNTPLAAMEKQLDGYLKRGRFESLSLPVRASLFTTQPLVPRGIGPAETCFRLGDELLRVGRADEAESLFLRAQKLAPSGPFGWEGLGFLEAERQQDREALKSLKEALSRGSKSFLVHYLCAREVLIQSASAPDRYSRLEGEAAAEVQKELETTLDLMPQFGPAHQLLGFFKLLQGEDLEGARNHINQAIELEPENPAYVFTLAEVEMAEHNPVAARSTLETLCLPYIDDKLRSHAEEMLKAIGRAAR
jgi:tetratricopeptide (TPR) repeat protein